MKEVRDLPKNNGESGCLLILILGSLALLMGCDWLGDLLNVFSNCG